MNRSGTALMPVTLLGKKCPRGAIFGLEKVSVETSDTERRA